jgi:hypothetical protein
MKFVAIAVLLVLTGCAAPVKREFPAIPPSLEKPCRSLLQMYQTLPDSVKCLEVVTENYALYHECQIKNETWLDWYQKQKKIFDSVK